MFKDIVNASRRYRGYDESYPSSVNAQPFRYYLAWENEEVDRIQKLTNWARALPQMQLPHPGMCPTGFIIICQDLNLGASSLDTRKMSELWHRPCFWRQLNVDLAVA